MGRSKKLQIEAVIQDDELMEVAESELQPSDFELVTNIVVGKLTSNAKEFAAAFENELKNYTVERYLDNPDAAKTDKAYLNKLKEDVADKRKTATATWNKPLEEFVSVMKDLENKIDSASKELKTITDKAVQKEKEERKARIVEYWNTLDFSIVPLERIFNPRWLNKTEKFSNIMEEIKAIIEKINGEMATLNSMQDEDSEILQSFYLETLDLNATLRKGNQLKENRARIKAAEERKAAENKVREMGATVVTSESVVKENLKTECHVDLGRNPDVSTVKEPVVSFRLEVTGPASKLKALRKFIDDNWISYKKI